MSRFGKAVLVATTLVGGSGCGGTPYKVGPDEGGSESVNTKNRIPKPAEEIRLPVASAPRFVAAEKLKHEVFQLAREIGPWSGRSGAPLDDSKYVISIRFNQGFLHIEQTHLDIISDDSKTEIFLKTDGSAGSHARTWTSWRNELVKPVLIGPIHATFSDQDPTHAVSILKEAKEILERAKILKEKHERSIKQ